MTDKGVTNISFEEALEEMELEYFVCNKCNFHIALDATYLLQMGSIKMKCPSCKSEWTIKGVE